MPLMHETKQPALKWASQQKQAGLYQPAFVYSVYFESQL